MQLPPHPNADSWRGQAIRQHAFRDSRLYKIWADCNMFCLTKCRRSDQQHYDHYTNLGNDLKQAIQKTKEVYGIASQGEDADLHICLSHQKRKRINHKKQSDFSRNLPHVVINESENEHEYKLCLETPLIGACTGNKIINGVRYKVVEILENEICVKAQDEKVIKINKDICGKILQLGWACVYQKVQGQTVSGTVQLHDFYSRHFKIEHLYVGLSRVVHHSKIKLGSSI